MDMKGQLVFIALSTEIALGKKILETEEVPEELSEYMIRSLSPTPVETVAYSFILDRTEQGYRGLFMIIAARYRGECVTYQNNSFRHKIYLERMVCHVPWKNHNETLWTMNDILVMMRAHCVARGIADKYWDERYFEHRHTNLMTPIPNPRILGTLLE